MSALPGTTGRRRLYLMRHGHVDYNSEKVRAARDPSIVELTEQGRNEARAAGLALADVDFDLAICSGLIRTRDTAKIVLEQHDQDFDLVDDMRFQELRSGKYINFRTAGELAAMMTFQFECAGDPGATFLEGGEAFADAMERVEAGLRDWLARPDWAQALLVAHEGINRMILSWVVSRGLGACAAFEQDTGCVNIIDFDLVPREHADGTEIERAVIKAVNLTPANYLKNGMNLRSVEAIFTAPPVEDG